MKTTNKIQKTALTALAAAGLAIISFTLNAQPTIKTLFEDIETNHIAMAMEKTNNNFGATTESARNFTGVNTYVAYLAAETEETLELENWMMEESNFATSFAIETETESPLQVEEWMTNEKTFDINMVNLEAETEEPMNVENWMVDEKTFSTNEQTNPFSISTKTFFYTEVNTEKALLLEDWMINPKIWNN